MNQDFDIIVVVAVDFTAINIEKNPKLKVAILERGAEVLQKVAFRGGRCNVTHACFEPNELVKFYPVVKRTTRPISSILLRRHHRMV
jgi:predicted flavoprotein YhiN